jgi:tetratricopeptide (TPR) repeat protein
MLEQLGEGVERRTETEKVLYLTALFHLGRFSKAVDFYQDNLARTDAPGAHLIYCRSLNALGRSAACLKAATSLAAKYPDLRAKLYLEAGRASCHNGDRKQGLTLFERALALDPTDPDLCRELARWQESQEGQLK